MRKLTCLALTLMIGFTAARAGNGIDITETTSSDNSNNSLPFILKKAKGKGSDGDGVKGKMIFTAGAGFNSAAFATTVRYYASNFWRDTLGYGNSGNNITIQSTTHSPIFNVMFDYGVASKFTVGVGFGYQTIQLVWGDGYINYTDTWKRIALAARGDFHFLDREHFGMYTGLRLGYNIYSMTSTATSVDKNYVNNLDVKPTAIGVQAHVGFSAFIVSGFGVNAEVGLAYGGPYFLGLGLTYKM